MKAIRVHRFGGVEVLDLEEVARPDPAATEVLVRVRAAGVGPWDAWVRSGKSAVQQRLPLTPGADVAGVVESVGEGVSSVAPGDEVYGATNEQFTGGYAEYAVADANMIARKPMSLDFSEAASAPVVATTAWQMVHDHARIERGTKVLIHGAAGNVGSYAVQFAKRTGAEVVATAFPDDVSFVAGLGADRVLDSQHAPFEEMTGSVDVVLDTVGGELQSRSFAVVKPGGTLVSSASQPDPARAAERNIRAVFFLVKVSTAGLDRLSRLFDRRAILPNVGEILPLSEARRAHEMLAGAPKKRGKIILVP